MKNGGKPKPKVISKKSSKADIEKSKQGTGKEQAPSLDDILRLPEHNKSIDPDTDKLPFESKALVADEDMQRLKKKQAEPNKDNPAQSAEG